MTTRWIVHRQLGVGEVLDGEGRQVTARFRSGVQVVNGKFRPVAADSLVVMFHRAPDEARALVRDDPLAVARALLGEMQSPATGDQLVSQARASGLTTDEADRWWAATHSLVDADPTIASQGDPPRYSLTAPDPVPSTEQEKDAKDSREGADPDGISLKSIEQSEDDDHLADLAFGSSSPEFARAAGRRLAERLSQGALGAVLEERIAPLVSALRADPEDAAPIVRDLDVVLRRAKPLVARGCPTAGLRMLLAADAVLGALAKDVVGRAPTALAQLLQAAAPDAAAFEQAIAPLSHPDMSGRLARLPLVPKGARLALLDAMAVAGRRTPLLDQAT